jgi:hypothetical protein
MRKKSHIIKPTTYSRRYVADIKVEVGDVLDWLVVAPERSKKHAKVRKFE